MHYDHLPIYKLALDLCVYVETIVMQFDKYHKYTIGSDLRTYAKRILFGIHKANRSYEKRAMLEKLVDYCEEFKMLVQLGKELNAFKSFKRLFEPKFIYDSYSNRKGRGIHKAVKRAQKFSRATTYHLQLDIKNFFYSIEKMKLFEMLKGELVENYHKATGTGISLPKMFRILNTIVFHDVAEGAVIKGYSRLIGKLPPHKTLFRLPKSHGLPIGNLTNRFFANVYMNGFDNFVKRGLKARYYIKYVDDFVLFSHSETELREWHPEIASYLHREPGLTLRDDFKLRKNSEGLDFLGYIVRPHYRLVRRRVVNNFKRKKARFLERYEREKGKMGLEEIKRFLSVQASFAGHIKHSNSYRLRNRVGVIHETNPFDYDRA